MSTPRKKLNKIQAIALDRVPSRPPSEKGKSKLTKIIPFFPPTNDEPKKLIFYYERSSTHRTAINNHHTYAVGNGFIINRKDGEKYTGNTELEDYLQSVNNNNESMFDVYTKTVLDYIIVGNSTLQINRTSSVTNVFHQDVSEVRKTPNHEDVFIYDDWASIKLNKDLEEVVKKEMAFKFPVYTSDINGASILYNTGYSIGRKNYGLPKYYSLSALEWINIEYKIPTYNADRIDNKFMPSGILTLLGESPDGMTGEEYTSAVKDTFTGQGNNSKLLVQLVSAPEQAPVFAEIGDEPEGIFLQLQNLAVENILRAHNLHPSLLMSTEGSLGESSEIRTIYELYLNTVVKNTQNATLKPINRILADKGFDDIFLTIDQLKPLSIIDMFPTILSSEAFTEEEKRAVIDFKPRGDVDNS